MFFNPSPTPYDLRWRMFGIPVRVHPTFWLFMAFFGWDTMQVGFDAFIVWMLCGFFSILVHELGHVFMGRLFGEPGSIVLFAIGGLAVGNYQRVRRWQRILISFAGPAAGLLLFGVVYAMRWTIDFSMLSPQVLRVVTFILFFLIFMNLFWSLLNLVPVYPLDGGWIVRDLCLAVTPRRGLTFSLGISFLCAGLIAVYSVIVLVRPELWHWGGPQFNIFLFGLLALQSYMGMQQAEQDRRRWDYPERPW